MIITTTKMVATRNIGTRVVATSDDNHRQVELWDFNATETENHERAAKLITSDGVELQLLGIINAGATRLYRTGE